MLQAASLSRLAGIRHAFFTRSGGVSEGVYATLNGGVGSNDAPEKVEENRARMAAALGVAPERLLTAYQIHSPDVVVADAPWTREARPRADAIVTRMPGLALGVSTADCAPLLFADAQGGRDRRRACRLARRVLRRDRGHRRRHGKTRRRARAHRRPRSARPSGSRTTRSAPNSSRALTRRMRPMRVSLRRRRAPITRCSISPAISRTRIERSGIVKFEDLGFCTFAEPARFFSYRRMTRLGEADYGRHINAIALAG